MRACGRPSGRGSIIAVATACALSAGCLSGPTASFHPGVEPAPYSVARAGGPTCFADPLADQSLPRELQKVVMPEYVIEPPDFVRIELQRVAPTAAYKIEAQDVLFLQIDYPGQTDLFQGEAVIGPDGRVNLGQTFGGVLKVSGLTIDEAKAAIEKQALRTGVKDPKVQIALVLSRALSQIRGEYLVRPDGTVGLGTYGNVQLVGQTLTQAKASIEKHLSQVLTSPEIAIDVAAYNSKIFYVIYDGGGRGQQVARLPITGNETVLDAVSQMFGLSPVSSQNHIWVARPSPAALNQQLILPVDWVAVTTSANTLTNYQLMPGDRIYVKANPLVTIDNWVAMFFSPFERAFGVTLLGQSTIQALNNPNSLNLGR